MWATGSLRKHWVEIVWVGFAALNLLVIVSLAEFETIPFHLIWVSLTIVYGYRVWSGRATAAALVAVSAVTGGALAIAVTRSARHSRTSTSSGRCRRSSWAPATP